LKKAIISIGGAMIRYLGNLLTRSPAQPVTVSYLSKAEGDPVWRDGHLVSVDPQGACFETRDGDQLFAECLPWGSIGVIRVRSGPAG
jgi:hypothetical protein